MKKLLISLLLIPSLCSAANHYIRAGASGSNNGSSWTNAWTALSSVTWTRGDTYYIAGGSYAAAIIQEESAGSTYITIKKANSADNSGDPGWNPTYASTLATITGTTTFQGARFVLDGVTGSAKSGHGIKLQRTDDTSAWTLGMTPGANGGSDIHVFHCEIRNYAYNGFNSNDAVADNGAATTKKGIWFANCWLHEATNDGFSILNDVGTSYSDYGCLLENCYVTETGGAGDGGHGQGVKIQGNNAYVIIRNCYFDNNSGSGIIYFIGVAGAPEETNDSYRIYNSVFTISSPANVATISPSAIASDAYTRLSNVYILNNTFANVGNNGAYSAQHVDTFLQLYDANNYLQNNVFETSQFNYGNSGVIQSNNGYYGNTEPSGGKIPNGTTNQVNGSSSTFVSSSTQDFNIKAGGYAIGVGLDLSSAFTTDFTGATRTAPWDIGAYKYTAPNGPASITAGAVTLKGGATIR